MGLKTEILDKILERFYEYPEKKFTVRAIASQTKIPKSTLQPYLIELKKKNLITKDNKASNTKLFKIKKTNYYIEKLFESGLIEFIENELASDCIILFGSFRKGESVKESDIDLFVETHMKKEIDLKKYERKLKHKIQLFIEKNIKDLQPRLFNNVVNGIKLSGSFKLK